MALCFRPISLHIESKHLFPKEATHQRVLKWSTWIGWACSAAFGSLAVILAELLYISLDGNSVDTSVFLAALLKFTMKTEEARRTRLYTAKGVYERMKNAEELMVPDSRKRQSVSWKTAVTSKDPGADIKMAVVKTSLRKSTQTLLCSRSGATPSKEAMVVTKRRGPVMPLRSGMSMPLGRGLVTPQRRGPVTTQRRGAATPQRRGSVKPLKKVPATAQRRGPVKPLKQVPATAQRRGAASPQRRGPVKPLKKGHTTPQKRGPVTPQRRGPVKPLKKVPATAQRRDPLTPRRHIAAPQHRVMITPCKTVQAMRPRRRRKIHPSSIRGRGQLKLSITPGNELLTMHIMEARGLMGKEYRTCNSYVKVVIIPDSENTNRQKTKTILDGKNPVFHERFVLAVDTQDHLKRLLVTVWNRSRTSRQSEFLGCMSFGMHSLITAAKEVSGWYYLLGEDLGRTKHLKVAPRRLKPTFEAALSSHGAVRKTGSPENMQCLTVTILRGKDGYGFTICSDSPVRVQAVDPGGPADRAGLLQLDTVLQLNGLPVEQWKCVDLAHAIRNCHSEITVVVWRTMPMVKPGFEGLIHRPSYKPSGHMLPSPPCKKREKTLLGPRQSRRLLVNSKDGGGSSVDGGCGPLGSDLRDDSNCKTSTQTLQGTRVTSSSGDNYIILAPLNPGSQILRPVYQDNHATLGRLYHPRPLSEIHQDSVPHKGGGSQGITTFLRRSSTAKTSKEMPPAGYQQNFANYQNCTVVHSHLPHSNYGTYVQLAPKILIFPIYVQPLDLCSPSRTLVLSEEMILHESRHLSVKVTVFIYTDLLLLTREDEPGRCNVLQNPLYLHKLRLQDDPTEGLRFNIIHMAEASDRVISLETYSLDQRRRVCQCLSDNIEKRQQEQESPAATEQMLEPKAHGPSETGPQGPRCSGAGQEEDDEPFPSSPCETQATATLPPDDPPPLEEEAQPPVTDLENVPPAPPPENAPPTSALSNEEEEAGAADADTCEEKEDGVELKEDSAALPSSSLSFIIPELRLDRSFSADTLSQVTDDEEEDNDLDEEEEEEEDSDEHCLEGGGQAEVTPCERHRGGLSVQNSLRRRTHSEGSLLQEPRPACFTSDNAINCLDSATPHKGGWTLPSPHTLKKELAKNGGSMHQICMLFSGRKLSGGSECSCEVGPDGSKKRNPKSLAKDMKNRLTFLRRKSEAPMSGPAGKLDKAMKSVKPSPEEALKWGESLDKLLAHKYGLAAFRAFLRTEFSEENLEFWLVCEDFKKIKLQSKMTSKAKKIFLEYIAIQSCKEVNLDSHTREHTKDSMQNVSHSCFDLAQRRIYGLMEKDSYPRFLRSELYMDLVNQKKPQSTATSAS